MSRHSRYNEIKTRRIPRLKRSIKLSGSGDDDGKWYRCWYCGFTNNIDRNALGDGEGIAYSIALEYDHDKQLLVTKSSKISESGDSVLINTNPNFTERHNIAPDAVSGCSFCGSLNWR